MSPYRNTCFISVIDCDKHSEHLYFVNRIKNYIYIRNSSVDLHFRDAPLRIYLRHYLSKVNKRTILVVT